MDQEEEVDDIYITASQMSQMDTDYEVTHANPDLENLSDITHLSRTSSVGNLDTKEDEDETSVAAQRMTTHTKALLAKLNTLTENLVVVKQEQSQPTPSQGQWATLGIGHTHEQELAFVRSEMVEEAVTQQFERAVNDRCNQSHAPKGVPLKPAKDRFARFQGTDSRSSAPAEANLIQAFLPKT